MTTRKEVVDRAASVMGWDAMARQWHGDRQFGLSGRILGRLMKTGKGDALVACGGLLAAMVLGSMIKNSWLAMPIALAALLFYAVRWVRRGVTPQERHKQESAAIWTTCRTLDFQPGKLL